MDTVSDIFAFVLQHGSVAEEVLFHDDDEPLAGLTDTEREAIANIEPHLQESWVGLLSACRESLWRLGEGHPIGPTMRKRKTQRAKMFERDEVHVPLVLDKVHSGIAIAAWGAERYSVHVWVWVHPKHVKVAEEVAAGLDLPLWRNKYGSFLLTLDPPQAGVTFAAFGEHAAIALWQFAKPLAEAVLASTEEG